MFTSTVLLALLPLALAQKPDQAGLISGNLGDAAISTNNPTGAIYNAIFPSGGDAGISGSVVAQSAPDGTGIDFTVNIDGLPATGGPFPYHIHDQPVPSDGDCLGTLAHLDPYQRGETPPCDASNPQTCQVGDLAGKHGMLNGTFASTNYTDLFPSLQPGLGSFFGNRSITIHFANTTRLACANLTVLFPGVTVANASADPSGPPVLPVSTFLPSAPFANGSTTGSGSGASGSAKPESSLGDAARGARVGNVALWAAVVGTGVWVAAL